MTVTPIRPGIEPAMPGEQRERHEAQAALDPITPKAWVWKDPTKIPPRNFLYGTHYIRKIPSAGFGAPGGGKSSKRLVEAIALASGRPLLGVKPVRRCKVWYWNGEDPEEELDRRIAAICLHYNIKPGDLEGYLFVNSGRDQKIVIARQERTGAMIMEPFVLEMKEAIKRLSIDAVILDPFVSTHQVAENDNPAIDAVVKKFADIADATDCSIGLEHHIRKTNGNEATVDDGRGASSLVGAARSIEVLNKMTKSEASKLGLDQPWRHFSVDDGKANMSPLSDRKWFKIVSVDLGNYTELYPKGDNVGVVTKWTPPEALEGVSGDDFEAAAREIGAGKWRGDVRAKDWIGRPIAKALKRDLSDKSEKAKVGRIIEAWLSSDSLEEYEEKVHSEPKMFIRVARDEE
jgi:hypothetical protein